MVKTFIIDYPVSILLGTLFSMFKSDIEKNDPFYRFISFWAGFLAWSYYGFTSILAYQSWPHWMWMYYLDPPAISNLGWVFLYIVLYWIPFLVGYLIGSHGRANSWMSLCGSFVFSIGSLIGLTYAMWDRYSIIAPSLDYKTGGVHIFEHAEYQEHVAVSALVIVVYTILCYFLARRRYLRQLEKGRIKKHLLHPAKRRTLQNIAIALLPEAPDLRKVSAKDMPDLANRISAHLSDFNLINRIFIRIAIDFVNLSPLWYKGKPLRLENLPIEEQNEILERIDNSPIFEIKISLKLVKMLILQQYYEDQRVLDDIGYVGESMGIFRKKVRWLNPRN